MEAVFQGIKQEYNSNNIKSTSNPAYKLLFENAVVNSELRDNIKLHLYDTRFTLQDAVDYLSVCKHNLIVRNESNTVTLNILAKTMSDVPPLVLLQRVIRRIVATINIFEISKKFNFWLVPCKSNRLFPKRGNVTPKHINGGFTYVSNRVDDTTSTVDVYVYRREEFPKVMLHETLHHSRIDTHNVWQTAEVDRLKSLCNIHHNTVFLPNEAVVELWAMIMHSSFVSIDFNMSYKRVIEKEQEWSMKQALRLLAYQYRGMKSLNLDKSEKNSKYQWLEDTNSYCYIVLKAFMFQRVDVFILNSRDIPSIKTSILDACTEISTLSTDFRVKKYNNNTFRMAVFSDM